MRYVRGYWRRDPGETRGAPSDGPNPWAIMLLVVLLGGCAFWALFAWLGAKAPDEPPPPVQIHRVHRR